MSGEKNREPVPPGVIARYTLVILAIIAAALFFWQIKEALLAAFAGVILAVIITGAARGLRRFFPISRTWSLVSVGLIVILVAGLFGWIFGSQIVNEFGELRDQLPERISEVQQTIRDLPMGEQLLDGGGNSQGEEGSGGSEQGNGNGGENQESGGESQGVQGLAGDAGGMLFQAGSSVVNALSTLVLILFIGIFFAIDPDIYKNGITLLFTKKRSGRINEALDASGSALWQWLMGQLLAMAFVGIIVTVGLLIIGVPLALILGVIAGLLEFIPYLGPIVAFVPAILLAFSVSPQTALFTAFLYLLVQQLEGNVITPLVQRRMVSLPPAIIILSVVAFGLVFGVPGVVLATPLAVIAMVMISMLYVQDVLGKEITIPGQE
ncbi:MAG: AI-2E family transporter [Balneolaceae bacterium]